MTNRILRTLLVVLALAAQAAAGFYVARAERQKSASRDAFDALLANAGRAQTVVVELRGAGAGLVATGQDPADWVPRITGLVQNAHDTLGKIDRARLSAEAVQDLNAATDAVAAFSKLTDHVRDLLATEQPLTASSVVFGEAAGHVGTASAALTSMVATEEQAARREVSRLNLNEMFALGGAAAWTRIVLLVLLPRVSVAGGDSAGAAVATNFGLALNGPPAVPNGGGSAGVDLDLAWRSQQAAAAGTPDPPRESEQQIEAGTRGETGLRLNIDAQVDLAAAARLCTDLARVREGSEIAGLLERAAELLDAAGIVLWIAGPDGTSLRPAASHGDSDHALARMRALSARLDNAVSIAFHTGRLEVVRGGREKTGAIVAPVIAPGGCVGAMAAEIKHGAETSPSVQAVATILAAQLASLVAETSTTTTT